MAGKPTYEELEQRVKELEKADAKREQAEEALRESEERFREMAKLLPSIICESDLNLELTYVNNLGFETFGYTPDEFDAGINIIDLVHLGDRERAVTHAKQLANGVEVGLTEYRMTKKDGSGLVALVNTSPIYEDGQITGYRADMTDITERKEAEEALQQSQERYRSLVENTLDGYFICEIPSGNFIFLNRRICDLFCYSMQEGLNITVWDVIVPEDYQIIQKRIQARVEGRESSFASNIYNAIRKDGSKFRVEVSTSLVTHQGKHAIQGIVRDVSEEEKLQLQLQQAEKMEAVGTLAGGVAHDLNNILSGLVSLPELLLMKIPDGSPLRKPIITIQESGQKAAAIVQDLLTLARRGVATTEAVNLNSVISEYLRSPEFETLKSLHWEIEIENQLETGLLNIMGSSVHLSKTLMNLVSNAAEAMTGSGKIIISTENQYIEKPIKGYNEVMEGDYVVLMVSDTGVGISSEERERIFEPFYTKKVMGRSGTGLGLAVIWATVKDHKGYIDIKSKEGRGTTFTLYFPVTRKELTGDHDLFSIDEYKGKGEIVLVIDDVESQREIASMILSQLEYAPIAVSSGEDAVEYVKNNNVDLLLLDMIMNPGMDGLETYRKILEIHSEQKAIIASGFSETGRVKEAQRLGAGQYVKKPYTFEKIGIAVRNELDK